MRNKLANTMNVKRFVAGTIALEERGAREASMLLVVGEPGYGKTEVVEWWADTKDAIYLCGKPGLTPKIVLGDLVRELGEQPDATYEKRLQQADRLLRTRQTPIILDEAQFYLIDRAAPLEVVRSLTDRYELSLVLVSMDRIHETIVKFEQISSRIAAVVKMTAATVDDVRVCCDTLCEVKIAEDLVEEIHFHTNGRYREIINAIALAERFGKRGKLEVVTRAAMAGEVIAHDWRDETPRKVRPPRNTRAA
ncbi:MAG: ATP-binding protein [Magnetococcales bacterium]|nr:ATP-binding protein [Magnetococcales bacterium]